MAPPNQPPSGGGREPVLTAGILTAATTGIIQVLFLWKIIPIPDGVDPAVAQATFTTAVSSVVGLLLTVWARSKVSPL